MDDAFDNDDEVVGWNDDGDEIRLGDPCPHCGEGMRKRDCTGLGCEDGFYEAYEDDPLWYDPGELERCGECDGRGVFEWCTNESCPGNLP